MSKIKINMDSLNPKTFKKTVRHKVKDGENVYRILPPFGPEAEGYPYRKWNVVWGLLDPNAGRSRPYASPSTYEGRCPVYDYLELLKKKVDTIGDEQKVKALNEFIGNIRPKSVYAYNASDKSGQVGVLELKTTAHKKILQLMGKYITDYNQDPTSLSSDPLDSGVWFNVTRTGKGFDTKYDASKNQTMQRGEDGVPQFKDDREPLAQSIAENYESLAYDLNTLYEKKTYEELKEILIANILAASQELPELLVEGFGFEDFNGDGLDSQPEPVQQELPQGNASVNLKLEPTSDAPVQRPADSSNTEDILNMAEEIFKS